MINFVFLFVFAAMCAASIYGWHKVSKNVARPMPIPGERAPYSSPLGLVDVGVMFATWVFGQLVGAMWLFHLTGMNFEKTAQGPELAKLIGVMAVCQFFSTGLGAAIIFFRYRSIEPLGLLWKDWSSELKLGLIAFALVVPPLLVLQWMLTFIVEYSHASMDALKENPTLMTIAAVWFGAVICAPVCEEFFFRGILQPWLQRLFGRKTSLEAIIAGGWETQSPPSQAKETVQNFELHGSDIPYQSPSQRKPYPNDHQGGAGAKLAIFASSLIFAGVHLGQGLAPIPLFVMGLVFGYLYFKTNSLLPCIVLHMGLNAFSMFWFTVSLFT